MFTMSASVVAFPVVASPPTPLPVTLASPVCESRFTRLLIVALLSTVVVPGAQTTGVLPFAFVVPASIVSGLITMSPFCVPFTLYVAVGILPLRLLVEAILLIMFAIALASPVVALPPLLRSFTVASPVLAVLLTLLFAVVLFVNAVFVGSLLWVVGCWLPPAVLGSGVDVEGATVDEVPELTPALVFAVCVAVDPPAVASVPEVGLVVGSVVDVPLDVDGLPVAVEGDCCDVLVVPVPLDDEVSLSANELPVCVVAASNSPPIIVPAMRCRFFLVLISKYLLLLNC